MNIFNKVIPKDEWRVHAGHCCILHGCKYSYNKCPVVTGKIKQLYLCESCTEYYGIKDWKTFEKVKIIKLNTADIAVN